MPMFLILNTKLYYIVFLTTVTMNFLISGIQLSGLQLSREIRQLRSSALSELKYIVIVDFQVVAIIYLAMASRHS